MNRALAERLAIAVVALMLVLYLVFYALSASGWLAAVQGTLPGHLVAIGLFLLTLALAALCLLPIRD